MKQNLLRKFWLRACMLVAVILCGAGSAWGETVTYSLTPNKASTGLSSTSYITTLTEFTYNGISWKMNQWNPSTLQVKTNQASATSEFRFYNTSAFPGRITKVVLHFSTLTVSNENGFMFLGGTSEVTATQGGTNGTFNNEIKTFTWTPSDDENFTYFAFYQNGKVASGTNKLVEADAIVVTYEESSSSAVATTTTIDASGITNTDVYTSTAAGSLAATVKAGENAVTGATVTWSGDNDNVATINASTGAVTLVAAGSVTFTASYAGVSGQYEASSATYEMTVTSSAPYVQPTTVEITPNYTFWGKTAQFSGNDFSELSGSQDNVDLSWSKGNGSTYANTTAMRFYKDNTLTFTAPEGYEIKSIALTVSGTYSDLSFAPMGYDNETKTWAGASQTVTMSRPSNADSYATISKFTITIGLPSTDPSISADDVEIAYNATSGSFNFTINNPVDGGSASVSENVDWISDAAVSGNNVTFTATANETKVERSAIVTLTYTYGDNETVTKEVTIIQAGNPNIVDNISDITAAGTYTVKGTIVAKSQRGFIVGDGTGYVYYYNQNYTQADYNIGDKVQLSGSVVVYGGVFEFNNSTEITTATESNYVTEAPTILTGSQMDTRVASTTPAQLSTYVQYEGTLTINNNHYNISGIDGASTAIGSISYPLNTDFTSLDGKIVKVKGYYVGVSSSTYYNTLIVSVEEVLETSITAEDVNIACDATSGEISYTINNPISGTSLSASEEVDWISDVTVNATNNKVTFTTTANTGAERSGVITLTYGSVTKDVRVTQAKYAVDYATLPFEYDGTGAMIDEETGLTQEGVGSNNSKPGIKFDTTGDYVILKINEAPKYLIFDIKGNPGSGTSTSGTFKVQTSADGTDYSDMATYSNKDNTLQTEVFTNIPSDVRYVKWIYVEKESGNIALGNIQAKADFDYTRNKPSSSVYGTLCLPYKAEISGGTLYNIARATFGDDTKASLQSITLEEVGTTAEAGKGYIIKFSENQAKAVRTSNSKVALVTEPIANNGLIGNPTTTGQTVEAGASNFVLQAGELRYCNTVAATNGEYRAYIDASKIDNHEVPAGVKSINLFLNGVDAIDGINSVIENAEIYNIAGQRMNKLQRGVNIVNGKKVLVK